MGIMEKRRIALAGGGIALVAMIAASDPIADIRITHSDVASTAISQVEAKIDLGFVAFSYLRSWKRVLP